MTYTIAYDFKNDGKYMKDIQNATLNTEDYGLQVEHGLVGTKEWWAAIDKELFPKITIEGIISKVFMSGHNDYPEFEIDISGEKSRWTRNITGNLEDDIYKVGKKVRLTYINQKFKKNLLKTGIIDKFVLTIEIER